MQQAQLLQRQQLGSGLIDAGGPEHR
jgi:hypothetical protein